MMRAAHAFLGICLMAMPSSGQENGITDRVKAIDHHVARINEMQVGLSVEERDLEGTTEGGRAFYYSAAGEIKKIFEDRYGETFHFSAEYYFVQDTLVFVLEQSVNYNRPIYWDSTRMRHFEDDQVWSLDHSNVVEERSYFEKGALFSQVNNQDCGAPFSLEYLAKEGGRMKNELAELLSLVKSN